MTRAFAIAALALGLMGANDGPVVGGVNDTITLVANTPTIIPTTSCSGGYITVVNTSTTLVATGFLNSTGLLTKGVPVCNSSSCIGPVHSRKVTTGVLYAISAGTPTIIYECGNAP